MTWYKARFEAGKRNPIKLFFYTDKTVEKQIEGVARQMLSSRTSLPGDNWELVSLVIDEDPPDGP